MYIADVMKKNCTHILEIQTYSVTLQKISCNKHIIILQLFCLKKIFINCS